MNRRLFTRLIPLLALHAASPSARAAPEPLKVLLVTINKSGQYMLNDKPVESSQLVAAMKGASERRPFDVTISASSQTNYNAIGKAVAAAHEAGVSSVRLNTVDAAEPPSSASQPK